MKIKSKIARNKEVAALLLVPLLMTILVGIFIVLPSILSNPTHDFIYYRCNSYCYGERYYVYNGQIERTRAYSNNSAQDNLQLFYYDMSEHESREISILEAEGFELDENSVSPEGYRISRGGTYVDFGVPFVISNNYASRDYDQLYLVKDNDKEELNLRESYSYDIELIAWVIDG